MTMIATLHRTASRTTTTRCMFYLENAPVLDYHLAGHLQPTEGSIEKTTYHHRPGVEPMVQITLVARNSNGIAMTGRWNSQYKTEIPPHDFGYGGCGLVSDLPTELVEQLKQLLEAATTNPAESTRASKRG